MYISELIMPSDDPAAKKAADKAAAKKAADKAEQAAAKEC